PLLNAAPAQHSAHRGRFRTSRQTRPWDAHGVPDGLRDRVIPEIIVNSLPSPAITRPAARSVRGMLATMVLTAASLCGVLSTDSAHAREAPLQGREGVGTIQVQQLPKEAQRTLEDVKAGGPFAYSKDGSRFGNYER